MKAHLKYLSYVLRHKWFVLIACWKMGLFWRGLVHDLSKFTPAEWFPYVRYFYGTKEATGRKLWDGVGQFVDEMEVPKKVQDDFDLAWNHHQKRNSHHWQYYLLSPDNPRPEFWEQSHDGGASHSFIANGRGEIAATIWDYVRDVKPPSKELRDNLLFSLQACPVALPMSPKDRAEMLGDWIGAGRALGKPDTLAWYIANKKKMRLHTETRAWIEWKLGCPEPTDVDLVYAINHREIIRTSAGVVGGSNHYDYP
jgi:hypothetical protein